MENRFLFRGKRIDNGEWIVGSLIVDKHQHIETGEQIEIIGIYPSEYKDFSKRIDPSTICQCTGLKDKNDKLIWENDICDRKEQYPEIVKYCNGDWTLDYSYVSNKKSGANYCNLGFYTEERKCVEVIGNIFDNPELLESEK